MWLLEIPRIMGLPINCGGLWSIMRAEADKPGLFGKEIYQK